MMAEAGLQLSGLPVGYVALPFDFFSKNLDAPRYGTSMQYLLDVQLPENYHAIPSTPFTAYGEQSPQRHEKIQNRINL